MAQTAMSLQNGEFTGFTAGLSQKQIGEIVKSMLKDFGKAPGRIKAAEWASQGKGLTIIKGARLTKREEHLASVGRAVTAGNTDLMHVQKAENLFADKSQLAISVGENGIADDLDELSGIMVGTRAFTGVAVVWNGIVMYEEQAKELASRDAQSLREEMERVEEALTYLESYDRYGAKILRLQYGKGWKVGKVLLEVLEMKHEEDPDFILVEATYHRWRKEAIEEFGKLVGLC